MKKRILQLIGHIGPISLIRPICLIGLTPFFLLAISYWLLAIILPTVFAQTPPTGRLDLTVSPPVIELVVRPGDKITEKFRIRNNLGSSIDLEIKARRLISDPTDGTPVPESEAKGEELNWVSFDKREFRAKPLEWQDIKFTLDIPESAAYGYYYVFSITPKEKDSSTTLGAEIKGEILVVTLLTVIKEGASSKTDLVSFKTKSNINEYLPVDFLVKLANRGNIHVKPRGNIFITRGSGPEIAILEVNPGIGSILPGGMREFMAPWSDGFLVNEPIVENGNLKIDERGVPLTKLNIYWNKLTSFRIGPYTARLLMVYDDGVRDVTIEGKTTFWIIPYTALAVIFISLAVLFIILRFLLKWYVHRAIQKSRNSR